MRHKWEEYKGNRLWEGCELLFANIFLTVAILLNNVNTVNYNDRVNKNQVSVEKNDILTLNLEDKFFNYDELVPDYFSNCDMVETRCRGFTNKAFENNFNDFYTSLKSKMEFLYDEIKNMEDNSYAFTSEYVFHRKSHILTEIKSICDKIDSMTVKQKRKIVNYEFVNNNFEKYDGTLGFSIVYNDKDKPFLIGTITMPDYIGELESLITYKSLQLYSEKNNILGGKIYAEPLSYFDRYFLNTVGFR